MTPTKAHLLVDVTQFIEFLKSESTVQAGGAGFLRMKGLETEKRVWKRIRTSMTRR